jgi:hypothetical protein
LVTLVFPVRRKRNSAIGRDIGKQGLAQNGSSVPFSRES